MRVFKVSLESILLHGSESWTLTKSLSKRFDGSYTRMLHLRFETFLGRHISPTILFTDITLEWHQSLDNVD